MKLKNLTKRYGDNTVIDQLTLDLPQSGLILLSGPSGCGKTTLLNLLGGFDTDYEGSITLGTQNLKELSNKDMSSYRQSIFSYIYQDFNLISKYSALDNIKLANPEASDEELIELLTTLGIQYLQDQMIETMSGGEKQRVAIARALIKNSTIVLADEPTASLDKENSKLIMDLLKDISKTRLVLISSHDTHHLDYADATIQFSKVGIVSNLTPEDTHEVTPKPKERIRSLKGMAQTNTRKFLRSRLSMCIIWSLCAILTLVSLSSNSLIQSSIDTFMRKNHHYNKLQADYNQDLYQTLLDNNLVENTYFQYEIKNIVIVYQDKTVTIDRKFPTSFTKEYLSYGRLPYDDKKEIAITPSLALQFEKQPQDVIGKTLSFNGEELSITGVVNGTYDDVIFASLLEQSLYEKTAFKPLKISTQVKDIKNLESVINSMPDLNFESAVQEVSTLLDSFYQLQSLFRTITIMIVIISSFFIVLIIYRIQNKRIQEIGLLKSLGYDDITVKDLLTKESILFTLIYIINYFIGLGILLVIQAVLQTHLIISPLNVILVGTLSTTILYLVLTIINTKISRIKPSIALK